MAFSVGEVQYNDTEECFRDLMRMLRGSFFSGSNLNDQKKVIAATISALKKELTRNHALGPTERLRLLTLEAESFEQRGSYLESARVLEPVWKELEPRLRQWSPDNPLEPSGNRALLRQKIWALLHYVFCHHYHVAGQHKQALALFLSIEEIIHSELEDSAYCPSWTLALCNYFIGSCYRVSRGFVEAERRMIEAQKHIYARVTREIKRADTTQQTKQYELDYKDFFCARIFSASGWIALQQGQLRRAEQHLRTAQSCLVANKQQAIGVFIDSLLSIVARRRIPYDDLAYERSLEQLADKYEDSSGVHELTRQRCAFELVRGFLDLAEFGNRAEENKKEYLGQAQTWLRKVGEFPDAKGEQRYQLHLIRLLIVKGDTEKAEAELGELRKIVPKSLSRQRSFFIIEAVLYAAQKDFDNARDAVMKALAEILPLAEREAVREYRVSDPVLEAECYVLLAQINAARKDYPAARHYLDRWRLLSQFVENHYLHRLVERIVTTGIPFQLECEYPIYDEGTGEVIKTIVQRTKEFELWLLNNARARHPHFLPEELSRIWGKDRSTYSRHFGTSRKKKSNQNQE